MTRGEAASRVPARQAIDACRSLTASMIEHAQAGEWSQVMRLEEQRRRCFDDAGPDAGGHDDPAAVHAALEALVTLDRRLNDLAVAARRGALDDLRRVRGKAAASARYYESSAGA